MLQVSFFVFLVFFAGFVSIMVWEPRTLWSGASFFLMMLSLGCLLLVTAAVFWDRLSACGGLVWALLLLAGFAGLFVLAFPLLLLVMFFIEGIRVVRHEGLSPSNLLSLLFAVLWFGFLFLWPLVGVWARDSLGTVLYLIVSLSAVYMLFLMAMYALSAILNLVHLRKRRNLDYIVVLGAGLNGDKVTPLLAGRIRRGIGLLEKNPGAKLIFSGGQGPGEELPESDAMAAYAVNAGVDSGRILLERKSRSTEENLRFSRELMEPGPKGKPPRVALVTTSYHVFRALVLARRQGMRCVGFGAGTKWYFTLNAVLREFAGYLKLTKKRHIRVIGTVGGLMLLLYLIALMR